MARNPSVDIRTFLSKVIEAHRTNNNQSWVAEQLGVSPAAVSLRLKALKGKGVKLPELVSGRSANTAEDANDILAELGFETE